ncbi:MULTISPECIES: 4-hydroxy-3-methylbut-2-enyl diphosphate reductase [unclassified Campylobacter]|uniref:4-hydroxy-3-methylbut-2-enyl diphosphate reductase n=1 Tax=unclassified Campylobacter TaxID=2593542 RepID=UPI0012380C8F|nr:MULTISPECIES: 4-hydroxy-3-methylbut-2-enyl diphosphate reductase [unclassified Campylobacter]KAA6224813.1 4-hydroxy-3-methylbut-2-enyl diphosphate reductase [Campylobacter sp. LR185c]KAA6227388.1 4-hydroxy-3-methylbut-2-enyl diphosphate reductase [Campylobacter sp. LR196d]KAA6228765.1 4-hydroxy-3-methylbut-2-enyl diphosphate reductase [Campylobacter sp. LR286c]KAA6229575.1 4-hydroxy-3-methylbut-2-enyl diphosphate reductase [Campylobacter sp. LR264d]KAA6230819.1 4-hydroxy-3-methylbut-2-enyl 
MKIELAKNYGFCPGVKRAIVKAERIKNAATIGPLIHNNEEIKRLAKNFNVKTLKDIRELSDEKKAIIRTHGITKDDLAELQKKDIEIYDATCPFVLKPQRICEEMSKEGYEVVIFGDENHPEVKGVKSYVSTKAYVVLNKKELENVKLPSKIAVVSQTTKKIQEFIEIVNFLMLRVKEVRVFNTICDATFKNQEAITNLAKKSDIVIIVGGKHSANTKQLFLIAKRYCKKSYLIENEFELKKTWFKNKKHCGISAGASTPEWIIQKVIDKIESFEIEENL